MAAAIKEARGVDATLIESGGGIFDVEVDGKIIYSKFDTDRFPTHEEILEKL